LQEFIRLLGGDRPNLIRTGDTNQSITTTFSSADTAVFRDFVKTADTAVHMDCSGRCAVEIIALANRWIQEASQLPGLEHAFELVAMRPVEGKNPTLLYPPQAQLFEMDRLEEIWLVERIQELRAEQPDASIAVLMRNNTQVNRITGLLHQAKIPAVSLSEQLNVSPVFTLILTTLQLLAMPNDLALQSRWHKLLVDAQIIPESAERKTFLETEPLVYQSPTDLQDEFLRQWYYDFLDFGRQAAGGNISVLIVRMSERFCLSVQDRSNGYLCALMAQDILNTFQHLVHLSPLEIVIHQFEAFQRSWRGKKSFGDVLVEQGSQVVQVMTTHKSKGQEFDVVFMPFLQADYFPHEGDGLRFDESDKLIQELDRIAAKTAGKPFQENYPDIKKREKIEEEARLIYVGLTRARRALYVSAHSQSLTRYNRLRNVEPAMAFRLLDQWLNSTPAKKDNVIPFREEPFNAQAP
jgi:DNA helicase-2/ATP-dependent DNA helicase PcrA